MDNAQDNWQKIIIESASISSTSTVYFLKTWKMCFSVASPNMRLYAMRWNTCGLLQDLCRDINTSQTLEKPLISENAQIFFLWCHPWWLISISGWMAVTKVQLTIAPWCSTIDAVWWTSDPFQPVDLLMSIPSFYLSGEESMNLEEWALPLKLHFER